MCIVYCSEVKLLDRKLGSACNAIHYATQDANHVSTNHINYTYLVNSAAMSHSIAYFNSRQFSNCLIGRPGFNVIQCMHFEWMRIKCGSISMVECFIMMQNRSVVWLLCSIRPELSTKLSVKLSTN